MQEACFPNTSFSLYDFAYPTGLHVHSLQPTAVKRLVLQIYRFSFEIINQCISYRPPQWSTDQSSWLQIQRSIGPHEYN
jgi:hypothetical protein